MTRSGWSPAWLLGTLLSASAAVVPAQEQQSRPIFRAGVDSVTVDVSVKHGNVAIPGLAATDFRLTDNGVAQTIQAVAVEAVPVDVTVFHDTSPSQGGRIDDLKEDVRRIAALLREGDRFRLLVLGPNHQILDVFGWRASGAELDLTPIGLGPMSAVNDGILAALVHKPGIGRRHLIVALTDGQDAGSAVSSAQVRDAAARTEGVLHLVMMTTSSGTGPRSATYWQPVGLEQDSQNRLREAAELTGGQVHDRFLGSPDPVDTFDRILDDFRASYVLRYTPTGVEREGWHEIEVSVPSAPRATVRARRGYYGS